MKGLDFEDAVRSIAAGLLAMSEHSSYGEDRVAQLTRALLTADIRFMEDTGVITPAGDPGENCYDDDDAFETLCDAVIGDDDMPDEEEVALAQFVDSYMDQAQAYFEEKGLLYWE